MASLDSVNSKSSEDPSMFDVYELSDDDSNLTSNFTKDIWEKINGMFTLTTLTLLQYTRVRTVASLEWTEYVAFVKYSCIVQCTISIYFPISATLYVITGQINPILVMYFIHLYIRIINKASDYGMWQSILWHFVLIRNVLLC